MIKKTLVIFCCLFLAFQLSAYAQDNELGAFRDVDDFIKKVPFYPPNEMYQKIAFYETQGMFECYDVRMQKGEEIPLQGQDSTYLTAVLLEGKLAVTIGNEEPVIAENSLPEGDGVVIHILPKMPYQWKAIEDSKIFVFVYKAEPVFQEIDWVADRSDPDPNAPKNKLSITETGLMQHPVRPPGTNIVNLMRSYGAEYTLKVGAWEMNGSREFWRMWWDPVSPDFNVAWHNHPRSETFIITKGGYIEMMADTNWNAKCDDEVVKCTPGMIIHFVPNIHHMMPKFEKATWQSLSYPADFLQLRTNELTEEYYQEAVELPIHGEGDCKE